MIGKSHLTIGLATYLSVWVRPLGPFQAPLPDGRIALALPLAIGLVLLGSLLPDIDHPQGTLARERFIGIPLLKPVAWGIESIFGHRGPTHSIGAFALILLLGQWPGAPWLGVNVGYLLGWGYASHLLADALTKSGIPLLWPLRTRFGLPPLRRLRFTTGTWPEALVVGIVTLVSLLRLLVP